MIGKLILGVFVTNATQNQLTAKFITIFSEIKRERKVGNEFLIIELLEERLDVIYRSAGHSQPQNAIKRTEFKAGTILNGRFYEIHPFDGKVSKRNIIFAC